MPYAKRPNTIPLETPPQTRKEYLKKRTKTPFSLVLAISFNTNIMYSTFGRKKKKKLITWSFSSLHLPPDQKKNDARKANAARATFARRSRCVLPGLLWSSGSSCRPHAEDPQRCASLACCYREQKSSLAMQRISSENSCKESPKKCLGSPSLGQKTPKR